MNQLLVLDMGGGVVLNRRVWMGNSSGVGEFSEAISDLPDIRKKKPFDLGR